MSSLSVLAPYGIVIDCASPIFLTSEVDYRPGAKITFEVLEVDASGLRSRLGKREEYGLDPSEPLFRAVLITLEPCQSTHPALLLQRTEPTLRGVLEVLGVRTIDISAE